MDDNVRRSVVWERILGGRLKEIADKHNISVGTVRDIIEEETGLDFIEVEKRATALTSQVKNLDETKSGLEQTIASLQSQEQECRQNLDRSISAAQLEIRRLEQSKAAQLADNNLTREQLA